MSEPRVVLVTGASSGIGDATARAAASRGDHVVLLARGRDELERVATDCDALGAASTLVVPTDVSDDSAVRSAVETATNLHGAANLARHVLPVLRGQGRQGRGSLVLVGSLIGHIAVPDMAAYVLSKCGVCALVRQLRVDNRDRPGLRFGYVAPGGVDTPIYRQAATYGDSVGRPPFPVASPERVAARALAVADRPWLPSQVGATNNVIRVGFTTVPWVYDRLVGPLFPVLAQDLVAAVTRGPGNVLASDGRLNGLRGHQGSALLGAARNLGVLARGLRGSR